MAGIFGFDNKPALPKVNPVISNYDAERKIGSVYIDESKAEEEYKPLAVKPAAPVSDPPAYMQQPDVPFMQCYNFIETIPKLQNAVLAEVDNVIARDWYYAPVEGDDDSDNGTGEQETDPKVKDAIDAMNHWEVDFELERLFEYLITDWSACGNCLIGVSDWQPVQLSRIWGLERNFKDGSTIGYWFIGAQGERIFLNPENFVHARYWDIGREPWSRGKFHSLFTNNWSDPDVRKPKPLAAHWRTMLQDSPKIHHKFAMPRIIYGFKDVNKDVMEEEIVPIFSKMAQGGRAAFGKEFTMSQETVDGKARFTDSITLISDEVDTGSGSGVNRIQTKASALADARVADSNTNDRYLGDMNRIKRLMDNEIIPRVLAQQNSDIRNWKNYRGVIEFRWGLQDTFDYDPSELLAWVQAGVLSVKEVRETLKQAGKPIHDDWFEQEQQDKTDQQNQQFQQKLQMATAAKAQQSKGEEETLKNQLAKLDNWYSKQFYARSDMSQHVKAVEYNHEHDQAGRFASSDDNEGYKQAMQQHELYLQQHPDLTQPESGYTYDPKTGKAYNAFSKDDRQELLTRFTNGGQDLYIIANTNNDIDNSKYAEAKKEGSGNVFFGGWTDKSGKRFTDTSFPRTGISDAEAMALKQKFKQQSILKIDKDVSKDPTFLE